MFRWKTLLGAILASSAVYAYSPIWNHVAGHYATRWWYQAHQATRTVEIRIHNVSSVLALPVTVRIRGDNPSIENVAYADPHDGPFIDYLSTVRHSESLRQFDHLLKRPIMLDEHSLLISLEDIETELKSAVLERNVPRQHDTPALLQQMTFANHQKWLLQCQLLPHAAHPCCMERAWEEWEYLLRGIQNDEIAFWRLAGVQLGFSDFHFVPGGNGNLELALPTGHSALMNIQFGPGAVSQPDVFTTEGPVLKVDDERDLDRNIMALLVKYPQREYFLEALIPVLALCTAALWVPLKYLSTHTLVNRACNKAAKLDAAAEWDEVYGRIKFYIRRKYDEVRDILGKPRTTLSTEQVFDVLRNGLIGSYKGGVGRFQTERQLTLEIDRCVDELARQ
jgi:hypothetical protein